MVSGMVGFLLHSGVDTHLYSLVMATLFWFFAGILMGYSNLAFRSQAKRILLVRTSGMGESFAISSMISTLRSAYPTSKLAMVVTPSNERLVRGDKNLDEVILFDDPGHFLPVAEENGSGDSLVDKCLGRFKYLKALGLGKNHPFGIFLRPAAQCSY